MTLNTFDKTGNLNLTFTKDLGETFSSHEQSNAFSKKLIELEFLSIHFLINSFPKKTIAHSFIRSQGKSLARRDLYNATHIVHFSKNIF